MTISHYLKEKQGFIFELDDVLYPRKDYLLQVYYLFAQFIEYGEQISATEILDAMRNYYSESGEEGIFAYTCEKFDIPEKYRMNFDLLLLGAKLPLKLLLFNEILPFLQAIVLERKQIFLLTDGDPAMQLNKIKQLEWNGLEQYLTVYFTAETAPKPAIQSLEYLLEKHGLVRRDVLFVGRNQVDEQFARNAEIDFFPVDELLSS